MSSPYNDGGELIESFGQAFLDTGYTWCHLHEEWHRPPQCALGTDGLIHTGWGTIEGWDD